MELDRTQITASGEVTMRTKLFTVLAAVVVAMCLASPTSTASGRLVPFKASDSGVAQVIGGSGDLIVTSDVATGHGTHVGRYTLEAQETINVVTGAITGGEFTLTAANGDTLTGTYSGTARPGLLGYDVSGPITGGTGRFASASGYLEWHGDFDPVTLRLADQVTGTITW
jgi:hypothetical protein